MRAAVLTDAHGSAATWTRDERTGALHMEAPLTWSGVREYPQIRVPSAGGGTRAARVLRRPEQITRPGYLATIERITPTLGHPKDAAGKSVLVTSENYSDYSVGSVGDSISIQEIDGYPVPVGKISVVAQRAIDSIVSGNEQVSQGFFALISPPTGDELQPAGHGIWQGPHGPEEYDLEHICDPTDPRALAYKDAHPDFPLGRVGANHIAVGIPAGRGLAQAQARPIAGYDSVDGGIIFLDECPPPVREVPKMKTRIRVPKFTLPAGVVRSDGKPWEIPVFDEMEVEEEDSPELVQLLTRMSEMFAMMAQEMAASQSQAAEAGEAAEAAEGQAAAAQEMATTAEADKTAAMQAADELRAEVAKLVAEVAPLRAKALEGLKAQAAKLAPGVGLDAAEDAASVRRAAVAARLGDEYADAEKHSEATINGAWAVLSKGVTAEDSAAPSDGFMAPGTKPSNTPVVGRAASLIFGKKDNK